MFGESGFSRDPGTAAHPGQPEFPCRVLQINRIVPITQGKEKDMRSWLKPLTLLITAAMASGPLLAHPTDAVTRAERAGRWLQLDDTQVQQLAHFITDTQLQRRQRMDALRPELLAVLSESQKARLAELMVNRELRLPRGKDAGEERLSRLQEVLGLSAAQVSELRTRGERIRAENQHLIEQRRQQLVAIVGSENAAKIEQLIARRRGAGADSR